MNTRLSFSVLTANIVSLLLIGTLYFSNKQRMNTSKDMQMIQNMMIITVLSNFADVFVFYLASHTDPFYKILVFLSGSWLFLANVLVGYSWSRFLMIHLNIPFTDTRKKIYKGIHLFAIALLIINLFHPIVFNVQNGIYERGPLYIVFLLFAVIFILDSLVLYTKCKQKSGTLKLFPVEVFLIPVIIGILVQAIFVEIAIIWTSIAVAIAGVMTSLKNELIFLDHLTGLYNRVYLEFLQKQAPEKKNSWVSGIMIDLNSFKQINDNYGHSEGDEALILVANILRESFSEYGVVTRYAGDEFVVMLNTTDEILVEKLIEQAKRNFEKVNQEKKKPYSLSASMGYAVSNLKEETIDDFMNRIDSKMYQDKLAYYSKNDRRKQ